MGLGSARYSGPVTHLRRSAWSLLLAVALAGCAAPPSLVPGGPPSSSAAPASPAPASPTDQATAGSSSAAATSSCPAATVALGNLARQGPADGVWVGMNLDWATETVSAVAGRLGSPPATVVTFTSFPFTADDLTNLDAAVAQARVAGSVLVLTLQPWSGLAAVTDQVAHDLAARLAGYGAQGVPVIVRFAHEMNGSWYPWGQDPAAYVAAFRRVADAVHAGAPTAAMLWAPNQGDGYPYTGGQYDAKPGSAAAQALDTNGDGRLSAGDDPYAPYWPGAAYVDWVGLSLYYWGVKYPWGANTVPAAGTFGRLVIGTPPTPNFYTDYAERYGKPFAIVETAAFYRPGGGGPTEVTIKDAWLGQVFSAATRAQFPLLRIVNWFEWRKLETEVNATVDWRVSADPALRGAFLAAMTDGFRLGPAVVPESGCPSP